MTAVAWNIWWLSLANVAASVRRVVPVAVVETSAHLIDHVLPAVPVRQWVLSFPWPLRLLFANRPTALRRVLGIVARAIETGVDPARRAVPEVRVRGGSVTLIQRFGSSEIRDSARSSVKSS